MHRTRITGLPALLLALAACRGEGPTEPEMDIPGTGPTFAISDAVHMAGVPGFFWLPPTVPQPGPTVTGTFDGDLLGAPGVYPQLEVRFCPAGVTTLCPASGAGSFKSFNGYSSTPITIHQAGNYQLNWNKNGLGAGNTHRAWVLVTPAANVSALALGFADVKVVANSQALKQIDANEFVGLVVGNPLYLKFTVRTGIPGAISVALGSSSLAPGGSTTATATVSDLHGLPIADAVVAWAVTPSDSPPGGVNPTSSTTGGAGTTTTTLTAGGSAGTGAVTATVGKAPAVLTGSASFTVQGSAFQVLEESLAGGMAHTCGLNTAGAPYCWGYNEVGQLGNGLTSDHHAPVAVILPAGVTGFVRIVAGLSHNCGLTSTGAAWCWGYNVVGQLGDNSEVDRTTPVEVILPSGVTGFTTITAGSHHTCGLSSTGAVYCWGYNEFGQLGIDNNSTLYSVTPVAITMPDGVTGFVRIEAGEEHTCALTVTGAAYCWGWNVASQLGNDLLPLSFIPLAVPLPVGVSGFVSLTAGMSHSCALTATGAAYCWGTGAYGELGSPVLESPAPIAVVVPAGETGFTSLAADGNHTCGLSTTGAAYCWGRNSDGQLGNNTTVDASTPAAVSLPDGVSGFARIAAGDTHTCALTSTGAAYCWGENFRGQVGDNSQIDRLTPQAVSGGLSFKTP